MFTSYEQAKDFYGLIHEEKDLLYRIYSSIKELEKGKIYSVSTYGVGNINYLVYFKLIEFGCNDINTPIFAYIDTISTNEVI